MKLYIVGIGPGGADEITPRAAKAIAESDVIAGYTVYIELLAGQAEGKKLLATPMKQETERCCAALDEAEAGHTVSLVCSGDAGVYGMAGLAYELLGDRKNVEIEVIPGITAACSGAALLGAPLVHDFAVISLSDLLTPYELIEKRLRLAAEGDFVICLYNPSSKKRSDYLKKACDIILKSRGENTVCGVAKNIGRSGESGEVMTLAELKSTAVDMFSTVFIGNSSTKNIGGKMVTPRGYKF
ncbi:MAG: precorrin-3B C(17)-methyltransferase [Hydrogenoanaerobacterium sp.]